MQLLHYSIVKNGNQKFLKILQKAVFIDNLRPVYKLRFFYSVLIADFNGVLKKTSNGLH